MRFIAVGRKCTELITSDRTLQSLEFAQGKQLLGLLRGSPNVPVGIPRVAFIHTKDGLYLMSSSENPTDLMVIDLDSSQLFAQLDDQDALFVFQKILRFSLRHWESHRLPASERLIAGTTKAALFPFPIRPFRLTVERNPDSRRQSKRGNCLLVYRAGNDEGDGPAEAPDCSIFRKALSGFQEARGVAGTQMITSSAGSISIQEIATTSLEQIPDPIDAHIGFAAWRRLLTTKQREFVDADLVVPHRIEGPAGTGKSLCLVLKAINMLSAAQVDGREHRALFIVHSEATRRTMIRLFEANDPVQFSDRDRYSGLQSLELTTLQSLCGRLLGTDISEAEFLDRDAMESKNSQFLYISEALQYIMANDYRSHRPLLSEGFISFLEKCDNWSMAEMLQSEISVTIKGRANENLDKYLEITRPDTGIPLMTDGDKGFIFVIFQKYQDMLRIVSQFDTDDIVLSALGQLNTPIWRRRREREGFDSIFIDETHVFNINELSVFHLLTRQEGLFPLAYSADYSQALQDRGKRDGISLQEILGTPANPEKITKIRSVFRCSPEIVNFAFAVTASGAAMFRNFDDPLKMAESIFTADEEKKCAKPALLCFVGDPELVKNAFIRAEHLAGEIDEGRSRVALVVFDDNLFREMQSYAEAANKPLEIMKERGDIDVVRRAQQAGRFVLSHPDYIGGLEFGAVLLVGIDHGRVPPNAAPADQGELAFFSYQAYSRLYVAITRAKYRVEVLCNSQRGHSKILARAIESGSLV